MKCWIALFKYAGMIVGPVVFQALNFVKVVIHLLVMWFKKEHKIRQW